MPNRLLALLLLSLLSAGCQTIDGAAWTPAQFSLLYPLQAPTARHDVNGMRLSVLSGRNAAVTGIDLGGGVNRCTGDLAGFQGTGLLNLCDANAYGLQFAGGANVTRENATGLQLAGISNSCDGSMGGLQVAGEVNFCGNLSGLQFGGFANFAGGGSGFQFATIANKSSGALNGVQISAFSNKCGTDFKGLQLGLVNGVDEGLQGVQIGLLNFARESRFPVVPFIRFGFAASDKTRSVKVASKRVTDR